MNTTYVSIFAIVLVLLSGMSLISGGAMNPARSLAPALVSGVLNNLWFYWSATFIGT